VSTTSGTNTAGVLGLTQILEHADALLAEGYSPHVALVAALVEHRPSLALYWPTRRDAVSNACARVAWKSIVELVTATANGSGAAAVVPLLSRILTSAERLCSLGAEPRRARSQACQPPALGPRLRSARPGALGRGRS